MAYLAYRGLDSAGNGRGGEVTVQSPWAFVNAAYQAGWRKLTVWVPGRPESIVGQILTEPDGRRTWWGKP